MTSPPSPGDIKVALEALRSDAGVWSSAAGDISAAEGTAKNLALNATHFSYIADNLGITQGYTEIQQKLAELLAQAEENFDKISDALKACADTYQREDEAGVHELNNVY